MDGAPCLALTRGEEKNAPSQVQLRKEARYFHGLDGVMRADSERMGRVGFDGRLRALVLRTNGRY